MVWNQMCRTRIIYHNSREMKAYFTELWVYWNKQVNRHKRIQKQLIEDIKRHSEIHYMPMNFKVVRY